MKLSIACTLMIANAALQSADVPDDMIRAIARRETSAQYHSIGHVTWRPAVGAIGEVSPWQLSPAVLRDMRVSDKTARIHTDLVYAESLTRLWLTQLKARHGTWRLALSAYHVGSSANLRQRIAGLAYADSILLNMKATK